MTVDSGEVLTLGGIAALDEHAAQEIRAAVLPRLGELRLIELDLSQTATLDSYGLNGLVWLYRMTSESNGRVPLRVVNPRPAIQQLLESTRLHRMFEVVRR